MPIKSIKIQISKNNKVRYYLMSQGSLNTKTRFLGQKVCPVACLQTYGQTDRQESEYIEDILSGFQDFSNFPSTYHQGSAQ